MASAYVISSPLVSSPFPKLEEFTSLGSKKKAQKRGVKSTDDAETLRKQRQEYEKAIRRSKRDRVLESKRKVLEKLDYIVWSDDEEDEENQISVTPAEILSMFKQLEPVIDGPDGDGLKPLLTDHVETLHTYLEMTRRTLEKDMADAEHRSDASDEETTSFAETLIANQCHSTLSKLLGKLTNYPTLSPICVRICADIATLIHILAKDPFQVKAFTVMQTDISYSLYTVLNNDHLDETCYTNSASALRILTDLTTDREQLEPYFEVVLKHANRASQLSTADKKVHSEYAISMIKFLTTMCQKKFIKENKYLLSYIEKSVDIVSKFLSIDDTNVQCTIYTFLAIASQNCSVVKKTMSNYHLIQSIVNTLESSSFTVITPAVEVLANLTAFDHTFITVLVELKVLNYLPSLLEHESAKVQTTTAQVVSNITACGSAMTQPVLDAGIISSLNNCLYFGDRPSQTKATEVVLNLVSNSNRDQLLFLVREGISDALSDMLSRRDAESLNLALKVFRTMYTRAQNFGVLRETISRSTSANNYIEKIYNHENTLISNEAAFLLEKFIEPLETEDDFADDMVL